MKYNFYVYDRNFGQTSKFYSKIEIFVKIEMLLKLRNILQKIAKKYFFKWANLTMA